MSKMTTDEYNRRRTAARQQGITEGSLWSHYKGGIYMVTGFLLETHHGGFLVLYRRVGGPNFDAVEERHQQFGRPPEEWHELVDDYSQRRFTLLTP